MVLTTETILVILAVGVGSAILLALHLEWRLAKLLRGKAGKDLEEIIVKNATDIERFKEFRKELEVYLKTVEKRINQSVRGMGTVRFNPFKGTGDGGNQSFASAFLNEEGDGVVFSTLYTRERVSVFAKPFKSGKSEYELTEEENEAIKKALKKLEL